MDRTNAERQRRYRTKLKAAAEAHRDGVDLRQDDRILSSTASFCWTIRVLRRRISALSQVQAAEYEARAKRYTQTGDSAEHVGPQARCAPCDRRTQIVADDDRLRLAEHADEADHVAEYLSTSAGASV